MSRRAVEPGRVSEVSGGSKSAGRRGEVGLTGELRAASALGQRLSEVKRLGFTKCMIPKRTQGKLTAPDGLELIQVSNIREAMAALL